MSIEKGEEGNRACAREFGIDPARRVKSFICQPLSFYPSFPCLKA